MTWASQRTEASGIFGPILAHQRVPAGEGAVPGTLGGGERVCSGLAPIAREGSAPAWPLGTADAEFREAREKAGGGGPGDRDLTAQHPPKDDGAKAQEGWEQQNIRLEC